ncbi:MAG: hypothetical protein HZC03_00045 [Candidatus Lloydbacteria bacterium]|nr:hypothetical protein [Candidatus Lloydbacteria bacterium]
MVGKDVADENKKITKPYGITTSKGKVYITDARGVSAFWILDLKRNELTLIQHPLLAGSTGIAVDEREYKFFVATRLKALA